jgi:hypothetical protein
VERDCRRYDEKAWFTGNGILKEEAGLEWFTNSTNGLPELWDMLVGYDMCTSNDEALQKVSKSLYARPRYYSKVESQVENTLFEIGPN